MTLLRNIMVGILFWAALFVVAAWSGRDSIVFLVMIAFGGAAVVAKYLASRRR